jgi:uncharacterized membrane protein
MNKLKHFTDLFVVTIAYLVLIVSPVFILLNILRICSFEQGLIDLLFIIVAIIVFIICFFITREARINHKRGDPFLW